jgi:hypothetical protein
MRFDFSSIDDRESFVSITEGTYGCRVAEVRKGKARDGSERWSFRLEVSDGEFAGRTATWDSLTWSERGIFRVKTVLGAFGFDVSDELEVDSTELVGRSSHVQLEREEWEDPDSGDRRVRLAVPYMGYKLGTTIANGPANGPANGAAKAETNGTSDADDWADGNPF